MSNKIKDIGKARREKRDKEGWTKEEIVESAKRELESLKKISEDEPVDLVSGDMDKIIRGEDDEEKE
jgi:hypothetical protein